MSALTSSERSWLKCAIEGQELEGRPFLLVARNIRDTNILRALVRKGLLVRSDTREETHDEDAGELRFTFVYRLTDAGCAAAKALDGEP